MKRALCIWLPNWPLQRLAAARAEPSATPPGDPSVVLYELHASGGARVAAWCPRLSTAASVPWLDVAGGIRPGMPLAEATSLAACCAPGQSLHLETFDPPADRTAIEALAEWCHTFSPTVGVEESSAPESLLLDITGLGNLCGGEPSLARQIAHAFGQRRLIARLAVADTLGAAWAVVHFAQLSGGGTQNAQAILAALQEPILVPAGAARAVLAPLPPAALRLPAETCDLLAELGLRRIEQVAALPRETLLSRFGPLVLARLDQATGNAAEAIVARAPAAEWRFEWLFEHPTGRREMIEAAVAQLVVRLCQALARERRGMLRLECRFEPERGPAERFVVGMYRPSALPRHVEELVRLKLETVRFREPLMAVRLEVLALDQLDFRQQEFFAGGETRESPRELAALVDRLSNRLGPRAVVRPWLLADAQAEFACQYRPVSSLAKRPARTAPCAKGPAEAKSPARIRCLFVAAALLRCRFGRPPAALGGGAAAAGRGLGGARGSAGAVSLGRPRRANRRARGVPSESKPAGGAPVACGATITRWKPTRANATGCFAN